MHESFAPARRLPGVGLLLLVLPLATAGRLGAQAPAAVVERGVFVVLSGRDTVAVERFARSANAAESELIVRKDGTRARQLVQYAADGRTVAMYSAETFGAGSAQFTPTARITLTFAGGVMTRQVAGQDTVQRLPVAAGALPWANLSTLVLEEITRRVRSVGGARVDVPLVNITGAAAFVARATTVGRDSIALAISDVVVRLAVDGGGRILGGRIPQQDVVIHAFEGTDRSRRRTARAGDSPSPSASR